MPISVNSGDMMMPQSSSIFVVGRRAATRAGASNHATLWPLHDPVTSMCTRLTRRFGGPPWQLWLLVCLCRQRARQTWLVEVAESLHHESGDVPGHPHWRASFHGAGLRLEGPEGESIDMDFGEEGALIIDTWFFANRVAGFTTDHVPEAELRSWLPGGGLVNAGLARLRDQKLIRRITEQSFVLCDELEAIHADVAALEWGGVEPSRRHVMAGLDPSMAPSSAAHLDWALGLLSDRERSRSLVDDVARLVPPEALARAAGSLVGPPDHVSAGLLASARTHSIDLDAQARRVLRALDPATHHPFIACEVARYLLDRGVDVPDALELVRRFAAVEQVAGYLGNPMLDSLSFLLLEYSADEAPPIVRRALRGSPMCAERTSMLLACIDQPWCHHELATVLGDPELDVGVRRRAARALAACSGELAAMRARALTPTAPVHDDSKLGFSWEEVDEDMLERDPFAPSPELRTLAARIRTQPQSPDRWRR